ncbi:MAG TPA: hypothetical protein VEY91_11935 [Candidatus Limnocylindria bacterium]|nr:hypothetical protein [Candidatus Limnocylindria bacterium]
MKPAIILGALLGALGWTDTLVAQPPSGATEMPRERDYSYIYDMLDHSLVRPFTRVFDPALLLRKVVGRPRQAANVGENDQVRLPSTWWQPRIGFRPVTVEQMMKGPGSSAGPAPGKWTVTKAKTQGVTPGFQIEDSKGDRFIIKFDPTTFPELTTSVDVIGSHLFWAAGYNVPHNTIATFKAEDLALDKDATFTDALGKKQPMTPEYLTQLLDRVARLRDGTYRCLASRFISGKPLGPFEYYGRRNDDPEDLIPHELRRELRGLWTVCAFLNHADSRGPNSLDMWVTENGRSFVRHHLIDFGSILGSSAIGPRSYVTGTEYYVDFNVIGQQAATIGLRPFDWERVVDPKIASIGFVEGRVFDPAGWRPDYANPAFDERTERDIRWGAKIVAGFTDEHIRAAVKAGSYSDLRASEYLTQVLIQRRDKLVRHWLGPDYRVPYDTR